MTRLANAAGHNSIAEAVLHLVVDHGDLRYSWSYLIDGHTLPAVRGGTTRGGTLNRVLLRSFEMGTQNPRHQSPVSSPKDIAVTVQSPLLLAPHLSIIIMYIYHALINALSAHHRLH